MADLLTRMHDLTITLAELHRELYDLTRHIYTDLTIAPSKEDNHAVPVGDFRPGDHRRIGPRVGHHETH